MKNLCFLSLLLISACTSVPISTPTNPQPSPIPAISPAPIPSATPIVLASPTPEPYGISFKCQNCDAREEAIFNTVNILSNQIIQSQCFSDHFTDPKYRSQLVQTNGLTAQQVVDKIRKAYLKDIPVQMYYKYLSRVYGYTYPNDPTIYLNRKYRTDQAYQNGSWSDCAEVSNEVHEATHKMGFDHDFNATETRPYSVPYTANFAVDSCCELVKKQSK